MVVVVYKHMNDLGEVVENGKMFDDVESIRLGDRVYKQDINFHSGDKYNGFQHASKLLDSKFLSHNRLLLPGKDGYLLIFDLV